MCPLIEAVANPAVSSFNSKIFCFGGQFDLKGANNKLQIYDSVANQWSLGNRTLSPQNPVAGNGLISFIIMDCNQDVCIFGRIK